MRLLQTRFPTLDAKVFRPVADGEHVTIPLDRSGHTNVQLLTIPVVHCIGSIMFVLKGYFGTVLCTGDFRFSASEAVLRSVPELQRDLVDDVYLDDTFLDPNHDFPDQDEALGQIKDFLDASQIHPTNPDQKVPLDLVLVKSDLWGKEELLVELAEHLGTLVVVTQERMQLLEVAFSLGILERSYFTTNKDEGRIVTVSYKPRDLDLVYRSRRTGLNIVAVIPSGWVGPRPELSKNRKVIRVGYSAHSSFSELVSFVGWLRPRAIHGISRGDNNEAVMEHVGHLMRDYPRDPVNLMERLQHGKLVPQHVLAALSRIVNKTAARSHTTQQPRTQRRAGGTRLRAAESDDDDTPDVPDVPVGVLQAGSDVSSDDDCVICTPPRQVVARRQSAATPAVHGNLTSFTSLKDNPGGATPNIQNVTKTPESVVAAALFGSPHSDSEAEAGDGESTASKEKNDLSQERLCHLLSLQSGEGEKEDDGGTQPHCKEGFKRIHVPEAFSSDEEEEAEDLPPQHLRQEQPQPACIELSSLSVHDDTPAVPSLPTPQAEDTSSLPSVEADLQGAYKLMMTFTDKIERCGQHAVKTAPRVSVPSAAVGTALRITSAQEAFLKRMVSVTSSLDSEDEEDEGGGGGGADDDDDLPTQHRALRASAAKRKFRPPTPPKQPKRRRQS